MVPQTSLDPLMVNGVLGESVTLPLEFPTEDKLQTSTWLRDGTSVTFIQPKEAPIQVTDPKLGESHCVLLADGPGHEAGTGRAATRIPSSLRTGPVMDLQCHLEVLGGGRRDHD